MPADIAMINGKVAMAYQNEAPWHKLGKPMHTMDVHAALKAAQLDWRVALEPMFYKKNDAFVESRLRKSVVRDIDQFELATVGNDYHVLQNSEAFSVLQPACEQFGVTIETAGALGRGDRVWMLAKLPESIEIIPGDTVEEYFLVLTGHNGWTSYTARGTDVRVVCANTLAIALSSSRAVITLKHVAGADEQLEQVADMVTKLMQAARVRARSFKELAARKLTPAELRAYVHEVLDIDDEPEMNPVMDRRRNTIIELAEKGKGAEFAPGSLWNAFNAITEYVDHVRPAEAKALKTIKQANESALFGANMRLKARALVLAKQLAA